MVQLHYPIKHFSPGQCAAVKIMLNFFPDCYFFWFVVLLLLGFKLHYKLTTGICRSTKRLDGKTVIVTGANTGIGKETALDLAQRGARVIMACRNLKRGKSACDEIIGKTGNKNVEVRQLDLSSLESVRKFARSVTDTEPHLHVLVNNAGVGGLGEKWTKDKLQIGMQVNHFGPFLLTCLLLKLMKKSAPSRIVIVSSVMHKYACFEIDNLNFQKWFDDIHVYSCSKLANILMANELSSKLKGTGVTVNSLHPGIVATSLMRHTPRYILPILMFFMILLCKNPYEGAQTSIYLAVSDNVQGVSGKYFVDCKEAATSQAAVDEALARRLWEESEILVGLNPDEKCF